MKQLTGSTRTRPIEGERERGRERGRERERGGEGERERGGGGGREREVIHCKWINMYQYMILYLVYSCCLT